MNLKIRPYKQTDYRHFKEMVMSFYEKKTEITDMNEDKIEDTVIELNSCPVKGRIIIFEYNEAIIGYAILIVNWSNAFGGNILAIDELYIKPEWSEMGIENKLVDTAQLHYDNVVGVRLSYLETGNMNLLKVFEEVKPDEWQ